MSATRIQVWKGPRVISHAEVRTNKHKKNNHDLRAKMLTRVNIPTIYGKVNEIQTIFISTRTQRAHREHCEHDLTIAAVNIYKGSLLMEQI